MPTVEFRDVRILSRDWGEEMIFASTPTYLGKVLKMRAGTKGGLQKHAEKVETFMLTSGRAIVRYDVGSGLIARDLSPWEPVHVPAGAVHQVEAVTRCVIVEASTPHFDDRVRCEQDYGLPEDGGLPTTR